MLASILYEQPLNERMRLFLRLEHLFAQAMHFQQGSTLWDSHASVASLVEILSILDRSDIRSETLKELDRHIGGLSRLLDAPTVDRHQLDNTLAKLTTQFQRLQLLPGKLTGEIRDNEIVNSVRQRTTISGGTCGFDIPAYHYFLNQTTEKKTERLACWLSEMHPIKEGIDLILSLIRNSALFERQVSTGGFFQKSLDAQNPCQLLRISLPAESRIYPEVSGSKHRVNVRFLNYAETGRPKQIDYNLEFDISCCAI